MVYVYKPKLVGGFIPISISTVYHLDIWAKNMHDPTQKNEFVNWDYHSQCMKKNMDQTTNQLRSYASPLALML